MSTFGERVRETRIARGMTKHYVQIYDADLIADFQQHSPLERLKAQKKTPSK